MPHELILSPMKLYFFILKKIYVIFTLSLVGVLLNIVAIALLVATFFVGKETYMSTTLYIIGVVLLLPLVIATEEFFHASACIARGKKSTLNNLIIGCYEKYSLNLFTVFFAVDYNGKFNLIDKLYISAAGPIATLYMGFLAVILLFWLGVDRQIRVIVLISLLVPCIGLIPSSKIILSDGANIRNTVKRLGIPWFEAVLEVISSVKYPFEYCFLGKRVFQDNYINPVEALRAVEKLLSEKKIDEAILIYDKLILIDPYNAVFYNNLAWLYYELGNYDSAIKFSKKSLLLLPDDPDFQHTLTEVSNAIKNYKCMNNLERS